MESRVETIVYKYNTTGFVVFGVYLICLVIAIWHVLSMSLWEIAFFGALFLAVPLYVQNSDNQKIRMLVSDERRLIFSANGVDFGDDHYPVAGLEAAAIYLESFTGFEYRLFGDEPTQMNSYQKANGDGNKISFRFEGAVVDFTFCLANYAEFCQFRGVINEWIAAGVNVVLKQAFSDAFILTEMDYYRTPSGLK